MKKRLAIPVLLAVSAMVLVAACSRETQKRWPVYVFNLGDKQLEVQWNDTKPAPVKPRSYRSMMLEVGKHKLTASAEGQVVDQVEFTIESPKDEDTTFIYDVAGASGFAVIDVNGLYKGGGVFALTDDKSFPLVSSHVGEKLIRLNTKLVLLALPGEKLPDAPPSMFNIQRLCSFPLGLASDKAQIRAHCLKALKIVLSE